MNISLDKSLLEEVALVKFGINEAFIEKDWFVTQVIKMLAENRYLDYSIIFTGGTSLSKAHKLIERFSEDIDFRVIAPSLTGQSLSKIKNELSYFKKYVVELLKKEFEVLSVDARDKNRHITIELAYPTVCEPAEALRPHIKLELTLSALLLPSVDLPVTSFINEVTMQVSEVEKIACINPVENAADKLSAIVWRIPSRVRGTGDKQPDVVRHLHDLAKLSKIVLESMDFGNLAQETINRDSTRTDVIKGLSTLEKLSSMMEILESDPIYPKEYQAFVKEMVYTQDIGIPTFEEALEDLRLIISKVTSHTSY